MGFRIERAAPSLVSRSCEVSNCSLWKGPRGFPTMERLLSIPPAQIITSVTLVLSVDLLLYLRKPERPLALSARFLPNTPAFLAPISIARSVDITSKA